MSCECLLGDCSTHEERQQWKHVHWDTVEYEEQLSGCWWLIREWCVTGWITSVTYALYTSTQSLNSMCVWTGNQCRFISYLTHQPDSRVQDPGPVVVSRVIVECGNLASTRYCNQAWRLLCPRRVSLSRSVWPDRRRRCRKHVSVWLTEGVQKQRRTNCTRFTTAEKFRNFTELCDGHGTLLNFMNVTSCWTLNLSLLCSSACSTHYVPALAP